MLFKRRQPAGFRDKLRELLWPRKGFSRPPRYIFLRLVRLAASPHAIAIGFAAGAFVSWTPFIGVHFVMAFALTYLFSGNMVSAALGCAAFGNPFTYPFIWGVTWEIGHLLLNRESAAPAEAIDLSAMLHQLHMTQLWRPVIEPMLVGSIPPGLLTGAILYVATFYAVKGFQARRRARLMRHARSKSAIKEPETV